MYCITVTRAKRQRRDPSPAILCIEIGKLVVIIDRTKLRVKSDVEIPFRERRLDHGGGGVGNWGDGFGVPGHTHLLAKPRSHRGGENPLEREGEYTRLQGIRKRPYAWDTMSSQGAPLYYTV